jgi:hypothetical protein
VRLDIDVEAVLSALVSQRPAFHSERDFQHAVAWQIQLSYPQAHIRVESRGHSAASAWICSSASVSSTQRLS